MLLRVGVGIYCFVGLLLVYGGFNYLTATEFMPYHALAIRADWSSLSAEHQGLILSLMKGRAAGSVSIGVAIVLLALYGLLRQVSFAFWLLPFITLVYVGIATYSTYVMHATTAGGPPQILGIVVAALTLFAALLSYLGRNRLRDVAASGG